LKGQVLLNDLIESTKKELTAQNYAANVAKGILVSFQQLSDYANGHNILHYSKELVASFMLDKYDFPAKDGEKPMFKWDTIRRKITDFKKLEWMYECSRLERNRAKIHKPLPPGWAAVMEQFERWQSKRYITEGTISRYTQTLTSFTEHMVALDISGVEQITPAHIADYILTMRGNAPTTMQGDLGRIRNFFKFAYLEGLTKNNLEDAVPKYGSSVPVNEANIWSREEIEQLLSIIDRGNATGKRDYAIILMAVDLGMRISDITSISFSSIDWERGSIDFNQRKTGKALSLPMSERVGLAIIDYLKYARPKTTCQTVFISHSPPYEAIPKFNHRFHWYVKKAGIAKKPHRRYGIHSLRNTIATRMLEHGVSFDVIFPFVGHGDANTLNRYLGMDIENLRKCALSFDAEVANGGI